MVANHNAKLPRLRSTRCSRSLRGSSERPPLSGRPFWPLDELKQLRHRESHGGSQALEVDEAQVAHAALDIGQVRPVDTGPVRQVFPRHAQFFTPRLNGKAEAIFSLGR